MKKLLKTPRVLHIYSVTSAYTKVRPRPGTAFFKAGCNEVFSPKP